MNKLIFTLLWILLFSTTGFGQIDRVRSDSVYWNFGNNFDVSASRLIYNQYPVVTSDSISGYSNPDSTLTFHVSLSDLDGDATYAQYRIGYSADSAGIATWLTSLSLDSTYTIPDSLSGYWPVFEAQAKATTGGRTGNTVTEWGNRIYNTLASNLFERYTVTNDSIKYSTNQLIDTLDYYAIWDSADIYRIYTANNSTDALLNVIDTGHTATLGSTAPPHTAYAGFTGAGSSNSYIDQNYNPASDGVHYRLNSASTHVYCNTNYVVDAKDFNGAYDGTDYTLTMYRLGLGEFTLRMNSALASSLSIFHRNSIGGGLTLTRTSATSISCLQNDGYYYATGTQNSVAIPNVDVWSLAYNNNGSGNGYSNNQLSFEYWGGQLTELQAQKLYEAEKRYLDYWGTAQEITYTEVEVKKDGTGDYTTIEAAINDITDASYFNRYNINFADTFYVKADIVMKNFVNLIGQDTAVSKIICHLPQDTTEAVIIATSALGMSNIFCDIKYCHIEIQNGRYAIHNDVGNKNNSIRVLQNVIGCKIIHKGNVDADAYYEKTVWATMDAYGAGLSGNIRLNVDSCYMKSYGSVATTSRGLAIHSATAEVREAFVTISNTDLVSDQTNALRIGFLYNNQDSYTFENVNLYGAFLKDGTGTYTDNTTTEGTDPIVLNGTIICD